MPYTVEKRSGDKPWKIVLKTTGEVVGSSETEKDAHISIWKRTQGEKSHDEGGTTASAPAGSAGITVATALKDVSVQYSDNDLEEGIAEEMEHTTDRIVAAKIATDHLMEDRDYYRKLKSVMDHASPVKHVEIEKEMLDEDDMDDEDDLEIEAFSTGTHISAEGDESTYTDADIDNMVTKYAESSAKDPAPVVIGHPQDNSPAYGWVKSAQRVGDKLMLKVHQLNKDFVDALKNHAYKKVSLSIYDDDTGPRIRHLGFLGAMPPAIKGLAPVSYASSAHFKTYTEELIMAEPKVDIEEIKRENSFFKKLFNLFKIETKQFSEEKPVEKIVDHVETNSVVAQEQGAVPPVPNGDEAIKMMEKTDPGEGTLPAPAQKQEGAEARNDANEEASENETLKKKITALESEVATLRAALAKDHAESQVSNNKAFCEELVKEGRLRPADVDMTVLNLEARQKLDEVRNYSEEQSSYRKYRDNLKNMPKVIEFGEFPNVPNMTAGVSVPGVGIDAKAYIEKSTKDKMAATPNISYWDALKSSMAECQEKNPAGYAEYMKGMIPSK